VLPLRVLGLRIRIG